MHDPCLFRSLRSSRTHSKWIQTNPPYLLSNDVVKPPHDLILPAGHEISVGAAIRTASVDERARRVVKRHGQCLMREMKDHYENATDWHQSIDPPMFSATRHDIQATLHHFAINIPETSQSRSSIWRANSSDRFPWRQCNGPAKIGCTSGDMHADATWRPRLVSRTWREDEIRSTSSLTVVRRCLDHLYVVHLGRWGYQSMA